MSKINASVYKEGINNTILDADNRVIICLINEAEDKILAYSEIRKGQGNSVTNTEITEPPSNEPLDMNSVGQFSSGEKKLTINPISYNRTKSALSDNDSDVAAKFAIIPYTGASGSVESFDDGTQKYFWGPTADGLTNLNIADAYLIGDLTSTVQINSTSNFMFGGATISFSEV